MRAPPETVKPTTGRPASAAFSNTRQIFSPTTEPMDPIIKPASIKKSAHSLPPMRPRPQTTASFSPEASCAEVSFSG